MDNAMLVGLFETFGILRESRGENLDRDIAAELRILRAKYLAHSAGADGRDDFVGSEPRAGRQGHGSFRVMMREALANGFTARTLP